MRIVYFTRYIYKRTFSNRRKDTSLSAYIFFNVNMCMNMWLRHVNSVILYNTVPKEATRAHEQLQKIRGLHGNGYYDGVEDSDCVEG